MIKLFLDEPYAPYGHGKVVGEFCYLVNWRGAGNIFFGFNRNGKEQELIGIGILYGSGLSKGDNTHLYCRDFQVTKKGHVKRSKELQLREGFHQNAFFYCLNAKILCNLL